MSLAHCAPAGAQSKASKSRRSITAVLHSASRPSSDASARRSSSSSQTRARISSISSTDSWSPLQNPAKSACFTSRCTFPPSSLPSPFRHPFLTIGVCGLAYRQGDYYRYLAEFARRQERERAAQLALEAYKASYKHAFSTLPSWHPTRLGVALNFSVYFHDVCGSPDRACHLAKHAFDEAVGAMHATPEHTFRDSLMILHLLRDDIILWSAEMLQEGV